MGARIVAVLALVGLSACSATRLGDVWTDPAQAGGPFRQVAVFAFGPDAAALRSVEDEFVLRLPATTRGVAGHGLVSQVEQGDVERVRARLRDGGFDGVMVVWMASGDEGGPIASRSFGDVYAAAQQAAQRTGDATRGGTVRLRTFLYSVASDALVWSAASRRFEPGDQRETTAGVARVVMERLQEAGLLAES
jgi:hypothetical protein